MNPGADEGRRLGEDEAQDKAQSPKWQLSKVSYVMGTGGGLRQSSPQTRPGRALGDPSLRSW
jgi:hypothetical protein